MKKRIALIVEDDPNLQQAMAQLLTRMGFHVLGALHYDAAVAHLSGDDVPHLVCVDLELPTESGYEVCEYIRVKLGLLHVPILVTSESGFLDDMVYAEKAGANAFLRKPFSMGDLGQYVRALVEERP